MEKLLEHPDIMTQGETLEELEENMKDAYMLMAMEDVFQTTRDQRACSERMKINELIKRIPSIDRVLVWHGNRHDLYKNPKTSKKQPAPQHVEIDEDLARHIIRENDSKTIRRLSLGRSQHSSRND